MKKIALFAVVLMLFATSLSVAQDEFKAVNKAGSKVLLFEFNGLGNFAAFDFKGGLGFGFMLSNNFGLRGILDFVSASQDIPYTGAGTGTDGSNSVFGLGLGIDALYYISLGERLFPYLGAGASFGFYSTEQTNAVATGVNQTTWKNYTTLGYNGGSMITFEALLGFDFYVWEELSFGAEYGVGLNILSPADLETTTGGVTVTTEQGATTTIDIASHVWIYLGLHF